MDFFITTFGCQMNENDSELISGLLQSAGHRRVETPEQARIIVVNTCCVRESAEKRALGYIGSLKKLYQEDKSRIIAVCGCMIQRAGMTELFQRSYRHVGILTGTFAAARLPAYIEEYALTGRAVVDIEERYQGNELQQPRYIPAGQGIWRAQVNVNYGCDNFCSYCIVPYVRGRERSRAPQEIVDEITALAAQGLAEVQLLGQNVNSYGHDLQQEAIDFAGLLTRINAIDGLKRIRYMTSHPRDFDRRLAETIASLPKVCRHFHLPIQSGADRILKLMNRGYDRRGYLDKLDMLRGLCPDATVTTDLIVGFPGESEEDFQQTLELVTAARFDAAYTFIYSRRSGTPAADFPGQVPSEIKQERLQRLMAVQNPISLELNQALVGRVLPVMVEGPSKNNSAMLAGRSEGNKVVVFHSPKSILPGSILDLRIEQARTWNLLANAGECWQ